MDPKYFKAFRMRHDTLLEEKSVSMFQHVGIGKNFLNQTLVMGEVISTIAMRSPETNYLLFHTVKHQSRDR